jgi:AraC family transcriptional regulator
MDSSYYIQKALDYIEANLKQKLCLDEIADCANYSMWHFHRMFFALTGFTVGEYIRRRRMSEATRELVYCTKSIKLIAAEYQFGSQEAFSRAFKSCCGISPGRVRKKKSPLINFPAIRLQKRTSKKGEKMLSPKIVHKAAFKVIGMSCRTTMQDNIIPQLWDDFNNRCHEMQNTVVPNTCLGLCMSEPNVEMTENTPFIYLAGVEVSSTDIIPEGMEVKELAESDYAVFEHHGSLDTLGQTYDAIYNNWMPEAKYTQDKNYDFEVYDDRFKFGEPDSIMEIWVPVKAK